MVARGRWADCPPDRCPGGSDFLTMLPGDHLQTHWHQNACDSMSLMMMCLECAYTHMRGVHADVITISSGSRSMPGRFIGRANASQIAICPAARLPRPTDHLSEGMGASGEMTRVASALYGPPPKVHVCIL